MSYYDFDDHFWMPAEVCGQILESEEYNEPSFASRIIGSIFAAFKTEAEDNSNTQVTAETFDRHLPGEPQQQL